MSLYEYLRIVFSNVVEWFEDFEIDQEFKVNHHLLGNRILGICFFFAIRNRLMLFDIFTIDLK